MRPRPIRPNIYLPVARFGVLISDWKFVFAATLAAYSTPFLLDLKLWGGAAGVVDGPGSGGALHCLFQLRAHRETNLLVATSIARDVYKPDPPACAPHGWRATSEAAMDYCGVKEK